MNVKELQAYLNVVDKDLDIQKIYCAQQDNQELIATFNGEIPAVIIETTVSYQLFYKNPKVTV